MIRTVTNKTGHHAKETGQLVHVGSVHWSFVVVVGLHRPGGVGHFAASRGRPVAANIYGILASALYKNWSKTNLAFSVFNFRLSIVTMVFSRQDRRIYIFDAAL